MILTQKRTATALYLEIGLLNSYQKESDGDEYGCQKIVVR